MKEIWDGIESFLKEHVPTVMATLNGPATEEDLNLLESEVGSAIPSEVVTKSRKAKCKN
jgi:cell wall assembly regulator SMI1